MAERDSSRSGRPPEETQPPSRGTRPVDEFERFRAEKALTEEEKAALPANLRRLLGWD